MIKELLFILLIIPFKIQSQTFEWANQAHWYNVDEGKYVCADQTGNLYVVGSYKSGSNHPPANSRGGNLSKYNSEGQLLWSKTAHWEDLRIAVDLNNNAVLTGADSNGYFITKFDPQGIRILYQTLLPIKGGTYHATISGIQYDTQGYYFLTGCNYKDTINFGGFIIYNSSSNHFLFLAKFDSNGNCLWVNEAKNGDVRKDGCLTLDTQGNAYVAGSFFNTLTLDTHSISTGITKNGFISKFDSEGNVQWLQKIEGVDIGQRYISALSADNFGNIYATGFFWKTLTINNTTFPVNGGSWEDGFLVKLNNLGTPLWVQQVGGDGKDFIQGVKVNSKGEVLVSGSFTGTAYFGNLNLSNQGYLEPFVAKYDSAGNAIWAIQTGGNGAGEGITVDFSDNVFLTGSFGGPMNFGGHSLTGIPNSMFITKISDNEIIKIDDRSIVSSFKIYPNPSGNLINISCSELTCSKLHLNIKNNLGQTVYSSSASNISNEYKKSIDLSQQNKGIYFIEIIADDKRIVKKVILQ